MFSIFSDSESAVGIGDNVAITADNDCAEVDKSCVAYRGGSRGLGAGKFQPRAEKKLSIRAAFLLVFNRIFIDL